MAPKVQADPGVADDDAAKLKAFTAVAEAVKGLSQADKYAVRDALRVVLTGLVEVLTSIAYRDADVLAALNNVNIPSLRASSPAGETR